MTTRSVRRPVPIRAIAAQYVAALIALAVTAVFGYLLLNPPQPAGTAEVPRSSVSQPH
ncbi:hypothetical protein APR11_001851 [Nocardia amikacinitolerans]|uniref:hypothetical protein n=1 Tax=Nocardia amikacinitolerans TaxID=756689 RepID=UPI000A42AA70|nr:hypothetical protein [Nocardia amikacinitolerans]MCP2295433.1 hypothetical protein [Nocardia amikacinitolerans]MCP2319002.1 hypothetical protein [Nocardia amikacinitolerans]